MRKVGFLTLLVGFLCVFSVGASRADDLDSLVKQLASPSAASRAKAATSLGEMGKKAESSVAELAKLAIDPDPSVRTAAIQALLKINPPREVTAPLFAKILGDADPLVALSAVRTMAEQGEAALPRMTAAVKDKRTRYWALLVISELGEKAKSAAPTLIEVLGEEDRPLVRSEIVMTLAAMGPEAQGSVDALRKELKNEHGAVIYSAIFALGQLGPASASAKEDVSQLTSSKDPIASTLALWAQCMISPKDQALRDKTVQELIQRLRSEDNDTRESAARALINLPKNEASQAVAVAEFEKIFQECPPEVVTDALAAIAASGPKAVPGLIHALKHSTIRPGVAHVLGEIGPEAKDAVPALTGLLEESDDASRREILFALGQIGEASAPSVPKVIEMLKDEEPGVRFGAVFALGKIGVSAAGATDALKNNLTSEDEFYRTVSAWALAHVNPKGPEVAKLTVPLLTGALKHERSFTQIEAANALGKLGPAARSALPALEAASKSSDQDVSEAAKAAVKKISGE